MTLLFEGQLIKTDPWVSEIFTEILNAVFDSTSGAQAHSRIISLCSNFRGPNPHSYFKWGFDRDRFWVQQRMAAEPAGLYANRLFTVLYYTPQKLLPRGN